MKYSLRVAKCRLGKLPELKIVKGSALSETGSAV